MDDNREEYNPAMFEVVSTGNDSKLILKDITVSDFGGMSVIRAEDGAAVSMENSWISGDISLRQEDNNEKAAIYLLGDSRLELDEDSGISNMKNTNVIYMTDNAYAKINGKISDIDNYRSGKTDYPLAAVIKAEGSSIADLNGTLENIKGACIKLEGNDDNTPIININGTISNAATTFDQEDGASLISATHGIINISGEINNFNIQAPVYEGNVYLINADSHSQCYLHKGASISKGTSKGIIGSLIYINDHSEIDIQGEISDNYIAGHTVYADNAAHVYIEDGALIEGNYFANHEIIYIGSKNSRLEMNGGTIRDNQFRTAVGVVQVTDRDSASSLADINAGTIVENHHVGAGVLLETAWYGEAGSNINKGYVTVSPDVITDINDVIVYKSYAAPDSDFDYIGTRIKNIGRDVKFGRISKTGDELLKELANERNITDFIGDFWYQTTIDNGEFDIYLEDPNLDYDQEKPVYAVVIPVNGSGEPADPSEAMFFKATEKGVWSYEYHVSLPVGSTTGYAVVLGQGEDVVIDTVTLDVQSLTFYTGGEEKGASDGHNRSVGFPEMHWTIDGHIVSDLLDENIKNGSEIWDAVNGYPFNIAFVNKATGTVLTPDTPVSETVGTYKMTLTPKENVDIRKLTINGKRVKPVLAGEFIIRPLTESEDNAAQKNAGIITDVVNEQPSAPVKGAAIAVINADTVYKINDTGLEPASGAKPSLIFDKLLDEETYGQQIETRLMADGRISASNSNKFDMRYLDLVDANNGNVWISSSKGATIYWPYPEHTDKDTEFKLWHFKDIHREYDIEGRIGAEEGIKTSDIEEVPVERTDNGISFFVEDADFSIFVLTWTEKKPVDPGKPDNSDKTGDSDKPDKSGNPDKPDESGKPGSNNTSGGSNGTGGSHGSGVSGGTRGSDKSSGSDGTNSPDKSHGSAGKGVSGGVVSGESYSAGINGNWVHMSPDKVNLPISVNVPEGATPVTDPEWHRWKFILNNGSMLSKQWAFIGNPYAANGQSSEGWFSFG